MKAIVHLSSEAESGNNNKEKHSTVYMYNSKSLLTSESNRPFARPGHMVMVSKLRSRTSKTKAGALFWKSHCATCSSVYLILYHVTGSCKGPIVTDWDAIPTVSKETHV